MVEPLAIPDTCTRLLRNTVRHLLATHLMDRHQPAGETSEEAAASSYSTLNGEIVFPAEGRPARALVELSERTGTAVEPAHQDIAASVPAGALRASRAGRRPNVRRKRQPLRAR